MEIFRHDDIEKDLRNLRKFSAPRESLESWENLFRLKGLKETPGIDAFPGFGSAKIYKARVIPLRENLGKSKGYRAIFQLLEEDQINVLVFSRHGIYHSEQELMALVKSRLST